MRDFTRCAVTVTGVTHDVYSLGAGPPVIIMHELPGLNEHTFALGRRLADEGFRVSLPLLFGEVEGSTTMGRAWSNYRHLCVSEEFGRLKAGHSAPIVDWLRGLARYLSAEPPGGRVGAIGMCLTGAFAIPLVLEPCVGAAVASQPSIPWGLGQGARQLNVADPDVLGAAERLRATNRTLLAFRFRQDRICQRGKLDRLKQAFGEQLEAHEYDYSGGWRRCLMRPHSVLTEEFCRAGDAGPQHPTRLAMRELVTFLTTHLKDVRPIVSVSAPAEGC